MATLTWRAFPVFALTVRQATGGKAVRIVAALAFIPALFAAIYLINPDVDEPRSFVVGTIFRGLVAPTLLPITVLILATGAFGNELEDNTLPYLILKPISRLRIVVEKFLGVVAVAGPLILLGLTATYALAYRGDAMDNLRVLGSMLAAAAVGVVAYAALFLLVSLLISRALLAGIIYSLIWESLLGRFLPGLRMISVRHFVESVLVRLLNDPDYTLSSAITVRSSLITLGLVTVISLLLATWRLRRMNLD
ncbi:MAG TPA: ABC transporter permease subunit [Thermomicrobiales bacterium]